MNRKRDAATPAMQSHDKPVDDTDMQASMTEAPETENIVEEGDPLGDNFA
ncbi:hypothetical protein ACFOMD_11485 [Sphingoaurantiacus capsulatus]|uniref:Uncharacterized protein n=1 Tax=Sphingoaurantiacus capsulatus TaxID=1771310 RepID=A0ABV7XD51_9SPHN